MKGKLKGKNAYQTSYIYKKKSGGAIYWVTKTA